MNLVDSISISENISLKTSIILNFIYVQDSLTVIVLSSFKLISTTTFREKFNSLEKTVASTIILQQG